MRNVVIENLLIGRALVLLVSILFLSGCIYPREVTITLFEPQVLGYKVTINGVVEGASGWPKWDWGDGTIEYEWFPNTHTYSAPGQYTLTVRACDAVGKCASATKQIIVTVSGEATLIHDDGSSEFGFRAGESVMGAVRFYVPGSVLIKKLLFYVWGEPEWVRVYVLNTLQQPVFSKNLYFPGGTRWYEVDLSSASISSQGNFYVGWMWTSEHPCPPCSWLGVDTNGVPQYRSYLGTVGELILTTDVPADTGGVRQENYMIRAVVIETP